MTRCNECGQTVTLPKFTRRGKCGVEHTWEVQTIGDRFLPTRDGKSVTWLRSLSLRDAVTQVEYDASVHDDLYCPDKESYSGPYDV